MLEWWPRRWLRVRVGTQGPRTNRPSIRSSSRPPTNKYRVPHTQSGPLMQPQAPEKHGWWHQMGAAQYIEPGGKSGACSPGLPGGAGWGACWSRNNDDLFYLASHRPDGRLSRKDGWRLRCSPVPVSVIHLAVYSGGHSPLTAPISSGPRVGLSGPWKRLEAGWRCRCAQHRRPQQPPPRPLSDTDGVMASSPCPTAPVVIPPPTPPSQDHIRVNTRLFLDGNVEEPVIVKYIGGTKFNKKGALSPVTCPPPLIKVQIDVNWDRSLCLLLFRAQFSV